MTMFLIICNVASFAIICDLCEDSIVFYCILMLSSQLKQFWYVSMLPDFRSGRTSVYAQKHSCSSQFSFIGYIAILEWHWIWAKINISVCINGACKNQLHQSFVISLHSERTLPCRHAFCLTIFFFLHFFGPSRCFSLDIHHQIPLYISSIVSFLTTVLYKALVTYQFLLL